MLLTPTLRCGFHNFTLTNTVHRRRISRAEYETMKVSCAAHIKLRMEQLNLSPSEVQRISTEAVFKQEQQAAVTMQELATWRGARQLPKGAKLLALAAVLKDDPERFVPKGHQVGRTLVSRHLKATLDELNGNYHIKVTPSTTIAGQAYVEARILLPTEKAYKLANVLNHTNAVENMRRMGMSEESIKETLAAPPQN